MKSPLILTAMSQNRELGKGVLMRSSDTDDSGLLRAIAVGDADAMACLYRRYLDVVVGFLRARVDEPEVAFDLTAETFAAVVGAAGRYRPDEGHAAAWLLGIARNKLLESWRRGRVEDRARRALRFAPVALEDPDLAAVEERAEAGSMASERLLDDLPADVRLALTARVVDERGYGEIAAELGCSEQVVRQRVSRGLRKLRAGLEDRP